MRKVLWVKFGWSEYYRGGPVDGNFGWLNRHRGKKKEGRGHEAFNFFPSSDGVYYSYVPPQSSEHAPFNDDSNGWTVICLAKNPKHTGIHIVGWYEDATLIGEWRSPPDALRERHKGTNDAAYDRSCCITAKRAYLVPPELRLNPFSDASVRRGKYSFLTGPNVTSTESKRRVLALLDRRLAALRSVAVRNPDASKLPDPEIDAIDPLTGFGTPEQRKKVEKEAEAAVIAHYNAKGFKEERVPICLAGTTSFFARGGRLSTSRSKAPPPARPGFFSRETSTGKALSLIPIGDSRW